MSNWVKNTMKELTYFLNVALCLICYFIVILFYIERKWLFMRNLARILPLKCRSSGKFQCFNAIDGSIKMLNLVEFTKILIKIKNCKIFYEAQKTSRLNVIIQPPPTPPHPLPSDKIVLRLFLRINTEIKVQLPSKCFKNAVLGVKKRWSANVFSATKQKHVCWKIVSKFRKVFWLCCKSILFSMSSELRFIK